MILLIISMAILMLGLRWFLENKAPVIEKKFHEQANK
jgi:hypothetical protein